MSSSNNYFFSIANQQVTAVYERDDGRWERESIDHDESYQVAGNQVIKREWEDGRQEVTTFQDTDGDGTYEKVSESYASGNYRDEGFDSDNDFVYQPVSDHDSYRFSIANQQVTAVYERDDGRWERESIDHDESYQVAGNQVIKREWEDGRQEVTTFQDTDGDGTYQKVSESYASGNYRDEGFDSDDDFVYQPVSDHDSYRFSIANQQVTAVYERDDGRWERESIDHDESYQVAGNQVIKREWEDGRQEVTTFQDTDGDGIYQKVSEGYASENNQNTNGTSDDYSTGSLFDLMVSVSEIQDIILTHNGFQAGSIGADHFIVGDEGIFSVLNFDYQEGDRLVFDTGLGLKDHSDLAAKLTAISYQDSTLEMSFGDAMQVSLTGVSANEISWDLMEVVS